MSPWSLGGKECVVTLVQRRCSRLFSSVYSIPVCLVCVVNKRLSLHPTGRINVVASTSNRRILEIKLINSFPPKIIWCYGIYPKLFDKMSDIEFHEGMPFDVEDITNAFVIIDDLMNEVGDDENTFKLVHERNPS
ncbi:uncharacterized protein TNCV_1604391 [Trichonephila clavipes]|nr:uncharacterized protein TNCV_1604391 [Trichonephila clavipes]